MKGDIVAAIKQAGRTEWEHFWDAEVRKVEQQLAGTPDQDLPKLKAKVAQVLVHKQQFLEAFSK